MRALLLALALVACGDDVARRAPDAGAGADARPELVDAGDVDAGDVDAGELPDASPDAATSTTTPCEEVCVRVVTFTCDDVGCCHCALQDGSVRGCKNNFSTTEACPL